MAGLLTPDSGTALGLLGAGLVRGDFGGGLLAANQWAAGMKERQRQEQIAQMQMQEMQMRMEDAQRQRAVQQQLQEAARQSVITPEKATSLSMGPMPDGSEPPMVAPGLDTRGFINRAFQVDPFEALKLQQSLAKDETPLTVAPGASLVDRRTMKPLFTAPKPQEQPSAVREYEYARANGYQGSFPQWEMERRRAGATTVSVGVNSDKSYFGNVAEGLAKNDVAAIDAGRSAPDRIASSRRVKEVLAKNPITGTGAEVRLSLNRALSTAGLIDGTNVANTEVLASTLASQTLDAIKTSGLGSGQGFTDKDRAFLERAKSGNIEMTPQALGMLADLNEKAARASITRANSVIGKLRSAPQSGQMGTMLEPIQEPAAPAPQKAVKRTGTLNGRRVIEYSDGTIEYAN